MSKSGFSSDAADVRSVRTLLHVIVHEALQRGSKNWFNDVNDRNGIRGLKMSETSKYSDGLFLTEVMI